MGSAYLPALTIKHGSKLVNDSEQIETIHMESKFLLDHLIFASVNRT